MKWIPLILIFVINTTQAQMDTTSYSAGLIIAKNLKAQGINELDVNSFVQALEDVFQGNEFKISYQDASDYFKQHLDGLQNAANDIVKAEGAAFLEENAKRPEVVTLSSGLQYEIMEQGPEGTKPGPYDKVRVHYHGTMIDGTVFDSSVERNEPISFPLNGVIVGWQEGLQLMTVGSKYKFYIPFNLAYGERGAGNVIKPYSTLVFEVSLLGIE